MLQKKRIEYCLKTYSWHGQDSPSQSALHFVWKLAGVPQSLQGSCGLCNLWQWPWSWRMWPDQSYARYTNVILLWKFSQRLQKKLEKLKYCENYNYEFQNNKELIHLWLWWINRLKISKNLFFLYFFRSGHRQVAFCRCIF